MLSFTLTRSSRRERQLYSRPSRTKTGGVVESNETDRENDTTHCSQYASTEDDFKRFANQCEDDIEYHKQKSQGECHERWGGLEFMDPSFPG